VTDDLTKAEESHNNRKRIAGGAGIVFLGRMGALIEAVAIIAFTWLYGLTNFGLYATIWSFIIIATPLAQTAMPLVLQRFVPRGDSDNAHSAIGFALKWSFLAASLLALVVSIYAPELAARMEADPDDIPHLTNIIRVFVWSLPFWVLVEVGTSAIRSLRIFGPEIKVRIVYEQGIRLILGLGLAFAGYITYGLFIAHFVSVFFTGLLTLRLLSKHLDLKTLLKAPMTGDLPKAMLKYARPITPAWMIKSLFSELPVLFLNFFLPGARGLDAAGLYKVARQFTSVLQMVGITFEYVMAPLAAEKAGKTDKTGLQDMFSYAVRLSTVIALPFCAAVILASKDILSMMEPQFMTATYAVVVLAIGRMIEAMAGPSTAIIDMLGHRFLPLTNFLMGLFAMSVLSAYLIPLYGVTGGAIAAAVAMNVTALLALAETMILFKLRPYDHNIIRPLLISLLATSVLVYLITLTKYMASPIAITLALAGLFASLFVVVRYGLTPTDAAALGPLARLSKRHKKSLESSK